MNQQHPQLKPVADTDGSRVSLLSAIGEPSFADVLAAIEGDAELSDCQRRFWKTSLRQMAMYLDLPMQVLPARIPAIGPRITNLHPERLNVHPKTFANHRAVPHQRLMDRLA